MYIAISGNIGSGKSTLTALIAARYGLFPVYEAVDENPYLPDFYRDMRAFAFHSQVFFLAKRLAQHLEQINGLGRVIQDRTIFEDASVFAANLRQRGYLSERDWSTYLTLYQGIAPALRMPDLLVHIDAGIGTLRERIAKRGRAYEREIPVAYLEELNQLYHRWLDTFDRAPILRIPGDQIDFVEDPKGAEWVYKALEARGLQIPALR